MYAIVLEKLPQALLSTTNGLKKREAWSLLKSSIAGLLRKLSTRYTSISN